MAKATQSNPVQQPEPRSLDALLADVAALRAGMSALREPFEAAHERVAALLGGAA